MKIVMNETTTKFFEDDIERHSSPTNGAWGNAFPSATGARRFFGGGIENGRFATKAPGQGRKAILPLSRWSLFLMFHSDQKYSCVRNGMS